MHFERIIFDTFIGGMVRDLNASGGNQTFSFRRRPKKKKGLKWGCEFQYTNFCWYLKVKQVPGNLKANTPPRARLLKQTTIPSMLQEPAQQLRTLPCGWSCDFSMAVFADLDLRASSDLKALRGLVENAAHRESPRLRGPRCFPSLASPLDRRTTFGRDLARPGLVPVSGMSLECPWKLMANAILLVHRARETRRHRELLPSLAPYFLQIEETETLRRWGICLSPYSWWMTEGRASKHSPLHQHF